MKLYTVWNKELLYPFAKYGLSSSLGHKSAFIFVHNGSSLVTGAPCSKHLSLTNNTFSALWTHNPIFLRISALYFNIHQSLGLHKSYYYGISSLQHTGGPHSSISKMPQSNLSIAVVCSSNMNRSMEAHAFLSKKGFQVRSFGTGDKVKLPGTAPDRPNVYDFSCTYEEIYQDLLNKDKSFYTQNGLLHMLDRNKRIKTRPERFQQCKDRFDIIVTCEERVYDQVVEYITNRMPTESASVHVINIDIQDNHEEATIGAFLICEMITHMSKSDDLDNDIDEMLHQYESKCQRQLLHCVLFY